MDGYIDKKLKKISETKKLLKAFSKEKNLPSGIKKEIAHLSKEILVYENDERGRKKWGKEKNSYNFKKIQIGGGAHALKGFLNIDIFPPAELICDVRKGLPIEDGCSELIFSEHFLEHIDYPLSVKKILKECHRILEPKGKMIIGVPDGKLIAKNYLQQNLKFYKDVIDKWYSKRDFLGHINTYIDLLNYHFRDQDDSEKYNPHIWTYDYEKLDFLLREAGFSSIKKWNFDKKIANPKRRFGSIYVVGVK
ncbi:MAG: methyltransferase domain-containing protein [Candidatus Paceibacterota bacterium]|jgi:SAM-dependent methyltransferase